MRRLARLRLATSISWLALGGSLGGCYVRAGGRVAVNPFAVVATAVTVAAVANAVSTPPPVAVDVGYYGYARPGYVWVNGRHTWNGNMWVWTPGYYQQERSGQYWVQGAWQTQGNQYVWVDGYWTQPRAGYVYVDGYYDYRDTGYVWMPGTWEAERPGNVYVQGSWTTTGGRRTWNRGGWQQSSTSSASGGVIVRDHR